MEEALTAWLLASPGLTELIDTRLTWDERPQGSALPAVVLNRIGGAPEYADEGEVGLHQARIQVDCWGSSRIAARQTARAVQARLSGADFVQAGVRIQGAFIDRDHDHAETPPGGNARIYASRLDFIIWHSA